VRLQRLFLAALPALTASCGSGSADEPGLPPELAAVEPSGVKVLLIGIDGATFGVLEPMVAEGRLPVFARLIEAGTKARLRSESPTKSPALWTTIATGRAREDHGIEDFMSKSRGTSGEPALVASVDRRTLALWNLVGAFERTVLSVGWWVTWPAEPVLGQVVSDRLAHSRWMSWTETPRDVFLT
jgi:predicted AlkP superfamily phosphohydrolase/phosphomutase